MATAGKLALVGVAASCGCGAMPLPLVAMASGVLDALLTSEIEPVTFPADVGANTTLNVAFWPAAMLIGSVRPEMLKPAPVTFALEIVRLALPPFCNVIVCELLEPIATAGKLALVGVAASCGCGVFVGGATGADLLPEGLDPATTPRSRSRSSMRQAPLSPDTSMSGFHPTLGSSSCGKCRNSFHTPLLVARLNEVQIVPLCVRTVNSIRSDR